jgi:hypothetical protein
VWPVCSERRCSLKRSKLICTVAFGNRISSQNYTFVYCRRRIWLVLFFLLFYFSISYDSLNHRLSVVHCIFAIPFFLSVDCWFTAKGSRISRPQALAITKKELLLQLCTFHGSKADLYFIDRQMNRCFTIWEPTQSFLFSWFAWGTWTLLVTYFIGKVKHTNINLYTYTHAHLLDIMWCGLPWVTELYFSPPLV